MLKMASRKPYYRKDGTFVSGSNDRRSNGYKSNNNNPKDELVGVVITAIILIIILIKCS